ncbi:MAG: Fe-S cluster assembly protein SufD [Crocinitomicaceae bacterium]|nr:Fe-S cluster assembly protein SufD [Crocinitomicaceae bacterium]
MSAAVLSEKMNSFLTSLVVPEESGQRALYDQLTEKDFPTTKNEYWKYTRVGKITNSKFKKGQRTEDKGLREKFLLDGNCLVVENGILRDDFTCDKISGVIVTSVKPGDENKIAGFGKELNLNHVFSLLNATYYQEVIHINIAAKTEMEAPLKLVFITNGENVICNPRIFIHADKSAQAKISMQFVSLNDKGSFCNVVSEFIVEENARLTIDKLQNESDASFHISTEQVRQEKNSFFQINTMTLDGGLIRNNINLIVAGENCESHMNGAIIVKGNTHVDNHTFVDHQVANCFSNENYKYVLEDKSTGVFNGRVIVQQHAQKINAYQKNSNILLSDFALMNSKPELEIYADDVKCSHGSTTGQLDDDAIFYLQARGISKDKAKKLLVSAFINEITDQFSDESMKDAIQQILIEKHGWAIN